MIAALYRICLRVPVALQWLGMDAAETWWQDNVQDPLWAAWRVDAR